MEMPRAVVNGRGGGESPLGRRNAMTTISERTTTANLKRIGPNNSGLYLAQCGRDGQSLWIVVAADGKHRAHLKENETMGWWFDAKARVWRPTVEHLAQRDAAWKRVQAGMATERDRKMLRIAGPMFGRKGGRVSSYERSAFEDEFTVTNYAGVRARFGDTASLPVKVECPRCHAENDVIDPESRP
jgi:hypothetical protein